jgi:hypothetical protein
MALSLTQIINEWTICWKDEPLKTMDGKRNLADADRELMQYLFDCLNGIRGLQPLKGLITHPLAHEHRIFSLMKEYRERPDLEITEQFVHMLQTTPVFRANADPRIKMEQYYYYGPLINWLKSKNLTLPDLPMIMSDSPEDFEQQVEDFAADGMDIRVEQKVLDVFMELFDTSSERQRAAFFYLAFVFEEPVFPLLWMADKCNHTEIAEGSMAANQYLPEREMTQEEFEEVVKNRERIAVAAKIFGGQHFTKS